MLNLTMLLYKFKKIAPNQSIKKNLIAILEQLNLLEFAITISYYLFGYNSAKFSQKKKMRDFYQQFLQKGELCFDVGANIGDRTEVFLSIKSQVICIEPQANCLQKLYKKFGRNKAVTVVAKGVSEKEGFAELAVCENASVLSTMSENWRNKSRFSGDTQWIKSEKVPVTTLDNLIKEYGLPVFCKIDVEGFEEKVIKGLTQPIPVISFEFVKELTHETKNCMLHLLSLGQYKFNFSIGESMELLLPNWVTADELFEKLDLIEDQLLWGDVYAKLQNN